MAISIAVIEYDDYQTDIEFEFDWLKESGIKLNSIVHVPENYAELALQFAWLYNELHFLHEETFHSEGVRIADKILKNEHLIMEHLMNNLIKVQEIVGELICDKAGITEHLSGASSY